MNVLCNYVCFSLTYPVADQSIVQTIRIDNYLFYSTLPYSSLFHCRRICSVDKVLYYRSGSRGFDSRGWTNTGDLKITEKCRRVLP